ncbi:hypothetical protein [Streptomyces sp. cg2]|uniref:hypothetical protein n=1 Tax=Streptomyces sp. cg2 TaxID=3238799 RepID=UPI0034E23EA3
MNALGLDRLGGRSSHAFNDALGVFQASRMRERQQLLHLRRVFRALSEPKQLLPAHLVLPVLRLGIRIIDQNTDQPRQDEGQPG